MKHDWLNVLPYPCNNATGSIKKSISMNRNMYTIHVDNVHSSFYINCNIVSTLYSCQFMRIKSLSLLIIMLDFKATNYISWVFVTVIESMQLVSLSKEGSSSCHTLSIVKRNLGFTVSSLGQGRNYSILGTIWSRKGVWGFRPLLSSILAPL